MALGKSTVIFKELLSVDLGFLVSPTFWHDFPFLDYNIKLPFFLSTFHPAFTLFLFQYVSNSFDTFSFYLPVLFSFTGNAFKLSLISFCLRQH